ncbi:MAG: T9SS type A sorting domain-containing protein [Saprospiraceae bacterium]|nr:T9SS type A sorting domain-containing protein [Saprospiraceae bacterium]
MKTRFYLCSLCSFLVFSSLLAQPFEQFSGGDQTDFLQKIIATNDGNLVTAGAVRFGQKYQVNLKKLSPDGTILWEKDYPSDDWEAAYFVAQTSDGGFILTGAYYPFPQDTQFYNAALLVMKTDSLGEVEWKTKFPNSKAGFCAHETDDHQFLIGSIDKQNGSPQVAALLRFSSAGTFLWKRTFNFNDQNRVKRILKAPGGGYFIIGKTSSIGVGFEGVFFAKVNEAGNLTWSRTQDTGYYGESNGIWSEPMGAVQLSDGSVIIANSGGKYGSYDFEVKLLKYTSSGNLVWKRTYTNAHNESNLVFDLQLCPDGRSLLLAGESGDYPEPRKAFAMMVDTAGYEYWRSSFGGNGDNHFFSAFSAPDSSLIYVGTSNSAGNGQYDQWLLKSDYQGNAKSFSISGRVWVDVDANCVYDPGIDVPAKQSIINIDEQQWLFSEADGSFKAPVNMGSHVLSMKSQDADWQLCSNEITLQADSLTPHPTADFLLYSTHTCPSLELGITTPDLLRCDTSVVYATWCNTSPIAAQGQALEIKLPAGLSLVEANEPYSQDGQFVLFEIGEIGALDCGSLSFTVVLDCGVQLGAAHCLEGRLMESVSCPPVWDGAFLNIKGQCTAENARFVLSNIGESPMPDSLSFRILEDGILAQTTSFSLGVGDSLVLEMPGLGKTIRVDAPQLPNYPGMSWPSATLEGCGTGENGFYNTGLFSLFHHDEGAADVALACVENTSSGLPNKIVEQPTGYGGYHILEPNTQNEYVIRFKNPYPDTIKNVKVRLKLSELLDISTFRMVAWSHPFTLSTALNGNIEFTLEQLNLPPASTDENSAYCFLRFQAKQLPDLPDYSFISSRAEIYFDLRGPLQPVNAWHNVFHDFIATEPAPLTAAPESYQYGSRTAIDFAGNIAGATDGNVYLAGSTFGFGSNSDGFLVKTDGDGRGIWYNAFDVDKGLENFYAVAPVSDGGCIVAGTYEHPDVTWLNYDSYDIIVMRVDANGKKLWHKLLRLSGNRGGVAEDIVVTADGYFAVGGYCYAGNGEGQFLIKMDEMGEVIWSKIYGYPYDNIQFNTEIVPTPDGGVLLSGGINSDDWQPDVFARKINPDGNPAWLSTFFKNDIYSISGAAIASDGNYILLGTHGYYTTPDQYFSSPYLLKINNEGKEIWEKSLPLDGYDRVHGLKIIPSPDNGFYVMGDYLADPSSLLYHILLIKYDANANVLWSKLFDTATDNTALNLILSSSEKVLILAYNQPDNWLNDMQNILFTASHTNDPSTLVLDAPSSLNSWSVSPNPSNGKISLSNSSAQTKATWVLYDLNGFAFSQGEISSNNQLLDFSEAKAGLYILKIKDTHGVYVEKIIIAE